MDAATSLNRHGRRRTQHISTLTVMASILLSVARRTIYNGQNASYIIPTRLHRIAVNLPRSFMTSQPLQAKRREQKPKVLTKKQREAKDKRRALKKRKLFYAHERMTLKDAIAILRVSAAPNTQRHQVHYGLLGC